MVFRVGNKNSNVESGLVEAYLNAKYIVRVNGVEERITPNETSPLLDDLMAKHGVSMAAFITPENPESETLSDEENQIRHKRFQQEINEKGIPYLTGYGGCDKGFHPNEESYLLFLDDQQAFDRLSKDYGQNSYLLVTKQQPLGLMMLVAQCDYVPC